MDKIIVNKKKIIKDFYKDGHLSTVFVDVLISLLLIGLMLIIFSFPFEIITIILVCIMVLFFMYITILKIRYVMTITNNIKKGNYKVLTDEITSINDFKARDGAISIKFKDYKRIVNAERVDYLDAKIGDKMYIVIVKGENEPIKIYDVKHSIIE